MDSRSVVTSFFACWRVQDVEMTAAHFHPEAVYTIHNGPDATPLTGEYRGPEGCRNLGYAVLRELDYLAYEGIIRGVEDDVVRARVFFRYRHRATGYTIDGTRRLLFVVKDRLILSLDTFEDSPRFEAFMRMSREADAKPFDLFEMLDLPVGRQKSGAGA